MTTRKTISESRLHSIIMESVKNLLNETQFDMTELEDEKPTISESYLLGADRERRIEYYKKMEEYYKQVRSELKQLIKNAQTEEEEQYYRQQKAHVDRKIQINYVGHRSLEMWRRQSETSKKKRCPCTKKLIKKEYELARAKGMEKYEGQKAFERLEKIRRAEEEKKRREEEKLAAKKEREMVKKAAEEKRKAEAAERKRLRHEASIQKYKEYRKQYYLDNKERKQAYNKQWRKNHPGYDREWRARQREKNNPA